MNKLLIIGTLLIFAGCKKEKAEAPEPETFANEIRFYGNATKFRSIIHIYSDTDPSTVESRVLLNTNGEVSGNCWEWVDSGVILPYVYKTNKKVDVMLTSHLDCALSNNDTFYFEMWHNGYLISSATCKRPIKDTILIAPK